MRGAEMAAAYVKALAKIAHFLEKYAPPYIARATQEGRLKM
jgi:hypothetical protein